ncbi:hypothetical protein AMK68_04910 [candidate division KD3-62 bacterium DG_56]|uniref:Uncharacterized protein n=1 Tax=candidate division KD3-62 bacterium DG_56 TaxID=1704032 RepID=A0A0S7XJ26_9BACT|nr:MAG: hypothetical protein AMK68_04910 [candidate division KD3-62 bacterium DG_56]
MTDLDDDATLRMRLSLPIIQSMRLRLRLLWQRIRTAVTGELLCDTCAYDWRGACTRPERPNARVCPDYRRGASKR